MSAARYRYPNTHSERVRWHEQGTPAPFAPYTSTAPDAYSDALLRGFKAHNEIERAGWKPAALGTHAKQGMAGV